ncbi:hypothetical protein PIB30_025856 [Stylosanthes scabra]|uniref:Disease resistance RPP13-like protein 1 n=2 Tax=Stylosanthes scabra TaxID=79078 RepID=A0ABU6WA24_9FABA|nr:hypothetical protein [Stylosanthes scabra]
MAENLYGGAYLSSFVEAILDNLSKILEDDSVLYGNHSAKKFLPRFEECLIEVAPVLDDAELKQFTDKKVKRWLVDLQDALYLADDYLDELSTKAAIDATQKAPGNSSFWSRPVDSILEDSGDLEYIVGRLESLVRRKTLLRLKETAKVDMSWRIPSTSLVVSSDIFGRDKDKEEIIKLLFDDTCDAESPLTVIPVWGMGGIGKTTLAQLVYSDAKVVEKFDTMAWVCVAENFDPVGLTRTILEKIASVSCDRDDFDSLQTRLKEMLRGKTFLVVLDDVWEDQKDMWEDLLKPFHYGNHGSKILLTTRSEKVASVVATAKLQYQLSLLSKEDCWSVFLKQAHLSADSINPTLEKVGKDIAKKCGGLPLAVQAMGGLLRGNSNVTDWNKILKSEIWEFPHDRIKVVPALTISYYYLPSCLKKCFVYCSLYPKDYVLSKSELILLWMAENFLQPVARKTLEEVGEEYFEELIARSLLQPHSTCENKFVMHDLMHDLAMIFAGEFYFRDEEPKNDVEFDIKTRHLSHIAHGNYPIKLLEKVCDRMKRTRTFLEINSGAHFPFNMGNLPCIWSQLKYLRSLSFRCFPLESLPDSIGELNHLRYLDLSKTNIVTLPESLGNLYNLQTLKLYYCRRLKMLPIGLQDLVNLRHLDIRLTDLHEMPKGMSKLQSLQFLSNYVVGKHEKNKINELGALANLHDAIEISHLDNVVNSSEASEARMSEKDGIDSLALDWSSDEDKNIVDSQIENDILDKLRPHSNLKELEIMGYRGTRFPEWLGNSSYHNITEVSLHDCRNCRTLPSLGQLPSLKHLTISDFKSVETVGVEFHRSDESCLETPFPMLDTLSFYSMPYWKEWRCSLEFNALPRLRVLTIRDCPMLRGDLPNQLPSLQSLDINNCEQLSCCCLPPSLRVLSIEGEHQVESMVEAIKHTELTCLTCLYITYCSSHLSLPVSAIPASLEKLNIWSCSKLEFQMDGQHHSLQKLSIINSCDSVTSISLDSFPKLVHVSIWRCEKMETVVVSRSLSCLRTLRIQDCGSLKSASTLWMLAPQLKDLILLRCPEIELSACGDPHSSLRSLEISCYKKLVSSAAFMNSQFHGLSHLAIHGDEIHQSECVKCLPKEGWLPASLEKLELKYIESVETLECKGLAHLTSLKELTIVRCPKLENIEGEKLPASLLLLTIYSSPLLGKQCKMKDPKDCYWHGKLDIKRIWKGLLLAWEAGYKEVYCETDCHEAYVLLKDFNIPSCSEESALVLKTQQILLRPWRVEVALIQRNANRVADAMAKHAIIHGVHYAEWLLPWEDLRCAINLDINLS